MWVHCKILSIKLSVYCIDSIMSSLMFEALIVEQRAKSPISSKMLALLFKSGIAWVVRQKYCSFSSQPHSYVCMHSLCIPGPFSRPGDDANAGHAVTHTCKL